MRVGVKDCTLQLHNLEIAHYSRTISRSRKCIVQSRDHASVLHISQDHENAQCNLEIAQILRLRGTYIYKVTVQVASVGLAQAWAQLKQLIYQQQTVLQTDIWVSVFQQPCAKAFPGSSLDYLQYANMASTLRLPSTHLITFLSSQVQTPVE